MHVLVADDNQDSRELLTKQLRASGHTVTAVRNGEEALAAAIDHIPDILVSDIRMPDMDGFQLCVEFRLNEKLSRIPVVFYSATDTSDEDERFVLSLGADALVTKPTEPGEFVSLLSGLMDRVMRRTDRFKVAPLPYSGFLTEHSKRLLSILNSKLSELETETRGRKKLERQLRLQEQLLAAATDMMYVTNLEWTILYVNQASCHKLGYERNELLQRDLRQFALPEHANRLKALSAEDETALETEHIRKDGTLMPVEIYCRTVYWDEGSVRLCIVRDVTARKKVEERLQEINAKLEQALNGTLDVIDQMMGIRDPYTAGHERRVAELAVAIAREIGLPEETCILPIRTAALIHDVGKIAMPADILMKPGRLTEIEFGLIKTHSQVGYDIIKRANFPELAADVVLQHHERLDGSGYPQGLAGDDILPEAQILAVADVVEAMSSHRPYRPALGIDAALEEISAGSGARYDPGVVTACLAVFREKSFTFST